MKKLLLLFLFIFIIPLVSAVSPHIPQISSGGLDVVVPKVEFFVKDLPIDFNVHLYDINMGWLVTNSTATCYLHIYNNSGNHILQEQMGFKDNGVDFYYLINSSLTSQVKVLPYVVWCNTSQSIGYYAGSFDIRVYNTSEVSNTQLVGLSVLVIGILFFLIYLANTFKESSKWFHQSIRLLLVLLSVWVVVLTANLGLSFIRANSITNSILTTYQLIYSVITYFAWIFTFMLVVYFMYELFLTFDLEKKQKKDELLGK